MIDLGVAGVSAGHWTGDRTGVTVVLFPDGSVGSGEIRGGAPATREFALLDPRRTVERVDAVCFAGGSAFGLAAADGVMRFLADRGQGYPTAAGPVPIVPTAAVFDLMESGGERPDADAGERAAIAAARAVPLDIGRVGAGTGATVGKWRGVAHAAPGGLGAATRSLSRATVAAIAVVNAVGDVIDEHGGMLAGSSAPETIPPFPEPNVFDAVTGGDDLRGSTTLVVVVTDASLSKHECRLLAESAHDGLARALRPSHTRFDGDLSVAVATGEVEVNFDHLRLETSDVVADAVRAPFRAPDQSR